MKMKKDITIEEIIRVEEFIFVSILFLVEFLVLNKVTNFHFFYGWNFVEGILFLVIFDFFIIYICLIDICEIKFSKIFAKFTVSAIFSLGTYEYFEENEEFIFTLTKIKTTWDEFIDLNKTTKTAEEICEFIKKNQEDIQFVGVISNDTLFASVNKLQISNKIIMKELLKNFDKNKEIEIPINAELILVKNTLIPNICIAFTKLNYSNSIIKYVRQLDLNQLLKYFLTKNELSLKKIDTTFFDQISFYNIKEFFPIHKNKWKSMNEIEEEIEEKNFEKNKTIFIH